MTGIEVLNLTPEILIKVNETETYPGYYNREQVALMCGFENVGSLSNRSKELPDYDLKIGSTIWWLPETIIPAIEKITQNVRPCKLKPKLKKSKRRTAEK